MPTIEKNDFKYCWPLSRVVMLLLAGTFASLVIDLRVEHVDIVRERPIGWLPIAYSAVMAVACLTCTIVWNGFTRRIMLVLFSLALVVGGWGFYLHNHGKLLKVIQTSAQAWTDPHMKHSHAPPQLAPLAFAGLGAIGVLTTMKRFNQ